MLEMAQNYGQQQFYPSAPLLQNTLIPTNMNTTMLSNLGLQPDADTLARAQVLATMIQLQQQQQQR